MDRGKPDDLTPLTLALLMLFGAGRLYRQGRMLRRLLCVIALVGAGLAVVGLNGCNAVLMQVPESYTVTVTASSGNVKHSIAVNLNVHGN